MSTYTLIDQAISKYAVTASSQMYAIVMICLSGFSPDATHFLNGIRVEQTGCLDRWFHLPHRTIKKVVDTLAH